MHNQQNGSLPVSDQPPEKAPDEEPPPRFRLQRTLDPIAMIALMLSLGNIGYQFMVNFGSAEIELLKPDQVEVRQVDRGPWVIVHAPMSYRNTARHNGLVTSEFVTLELPEIARKGRALTLHWQSFIRTDPGQEDAIRVDEDAQPFAVNGNQGASHQTAFYPRYVPCLNDCSDGEEYRNYLRWEELLTLTEREDRLVLKFTAVLIDGSELDVSCYMPLDGNMRAYMRNHRIFTRTCVAQGE